MYRALLITCLMLWLASCGNAETQDVDITVPTATLEAEVELAAGHALAAKAAERALATKSAADTASTVKRCPECGRQSWRGYYNEVEQGAVFIDCRDGSTYPILPEGDFRALKTAFLRAQHIANRGLMVRLQGSLIQRSVPPNLPPRAHLLVQLFQNTLPGHDCNGPRSNPDKKKRDRAIAARAIYQGSGSKA